MEPTIKANKEDVTTYSNFEDIRQEHLAIKAKIDFDKQIIQGTVDIRFKIISKNVLHIILDMKKVIIKSITCTQYPNEQIKYSTYDCNPDKEALGTPIALSLTSTISTLMHDKINILIAFETTSDSPSVKFLSKDQTLTKNFPFMFTQCEPILCRTLFPCQDTPGAKVTCEAELTLMKGMVALFSGIEVESKRKEETDKVTFYYEQTLPIPTYLIALACGELEYGKLSDRCGVWTEKGLKEKALYEFESTEKFLSTAENYLTPYEWKIYNILVLPASFPYGGMENPCLTFVTPTLLAGDQSLANVIAHEISHSWTGNLVTNKNWANFWMNEGFTTFLERKIGELVYGEEFSILEKEVGKGGLIETINDIGKEHNFTSLAPNFEHCDPDDGFSRIPYEKGFTFLQYLEDLVGKAKFQSILKTYIEKFKYLSVSYEDFKDIFEKETLNDPNINIESIKAIEWEKWVTSPGYPLHMKDYNSVLIQKAIDLANEFLKNKLSDESIAYSVFKAWHTNQKIVFLNFLIENIKQITNDVYALLDRVLKFNDSSISYNTEIISLWYLISLRTHHSKVILEGLKNFLAKYGRMKYIRPLYMTWYNSNTSEAKEYFSKVKHLYHSVASRLIEDKLI